MSVNCIEVQSNKEKKLFVEFPKRLYKGKFCTLNKDTEYKILNGIHPLSVDFDVFPFLIMEDNKRVVARALLTVYPNDKNGYVGFFESENNQIAVELLFYVISKRAREKGLTKLVGPMDCSIWLKYRFKTDCFDKCFTGEPYNLDYYEEMWRKVGFVDSVKYFSNQYRIPNEDDINERIERVASKLLERRNYIFKTPSDIGVECFLSECYDVLIDVYSDFPYYKYLTRTQFIMLYEYLGKLVNSHLVELVYDGKKEIPKVVGFLVCLPNYSDIVYNLNLVNLFKFNKIKKNTSEYVLLYIGANPKHLGLGGVIVSRCKKFLQEKGCTSINALIREGNQSGKFYDELTVGKYNYVMLEKSLKG